MCPFLHTALPEQDLSLHWNWPSEPLNLALHEEQPNTGYSPHMTSGPVIITN